MQSTFGTERDPLIPSDDVGSKKTTSLPKWQLFNVYLVRAVEPLSNQVVYPFINQMLVSVGAADSPETVGYASGIVETASTSAQLATVFLWGSLSDRIGRKPVLIMGCLGAALGGSLFGLSRSFAMLLVTRMACTALNGNMAVIKAVVGELTDPSNSARAFSLFPVFLNVGNLMAATIGGSLGDINRYPYLASLRIFQSFPYLLPNLTAAAVTLAVSIIAAFNVHETLPERPLSSEDEDRSGAEATPEHTLLTRNITAIIFSFGALSLVSGMFSSLLPLYCYTPISRGGLGFPAADIAKAVSTRSIMTLLIQLLIFPPLQKRVGTLRLYRWLLCGYIPVYIGLPLVNRLARSGKDGSVWVSLTTVLLMSSIANMAFVCNLILITAASPSPHLLGAINGYSQAVSGAVNMVGRGGAQALFALSVNKNILGGDFIWLVIVCLCVVSVGSAWLIRQP